MIRYKYEVKTYTKTERVLVSEKRYCDCCNKEIVGPHWQVMTGHLDWGNDSVESIEHKDACSVECLITLFREYCDRSDHDNNTEYFEVEHERSSDVRGEISYDQN